MERRATLQSVKGTKDILPHDSVAWRHLEQVIREVMHRYCYGEIRTPIFEDTAVFARGIGEETDIVGKEMYTFNDKGGSSLTLRPEMTAPVIRSYIQHGLGDQRVLNKLYYIGPMFRQERPQAGRFRQFHQFGFESIGQTSPECDAEIIAMASDIYTRLGISFTLKINSVGDSTCRPQYREVLQSFLHSVHDTLSTESQRRALSNPMRVLDSKDERDKEATKHAPVILDYLSDTCQQHFQRTCALLDEIGIGYVVDPRLVRGLDYYTMTAFEFISADIGSQDALGGGGRYDGLVTQLGGKETPAVGFAAGIERMLMVMEKNGYAFPEDSPEVYLIGIDSASREWVFQTAITLRTSGLSVEFDYADRSVKAQMREANRLGCPYVVIVGETELQSGTAQVKNMREGTQESVEFSSLIEYMTTLQHH